MTTKRDGLNAIDGARLALGTPVRCTWQAVAGNVGAVSLHVLGSLEVSSPEVESTGTYSSYPSAKPLPSPAKLQVLQG